MNISRILEKFDECDRAKFCEAIADASHYVATALDVLPASDHFSFPELCRALNHLNDLNDEIQAHLCDADDDAGNKALQEAYDIIAADDAETLDFSGIEKAIAAEKKSAKAKKNKKPEFFGHAKAWRMKKQQAKKAEASEGVE